MLRKVGKRKHKHDKKKNIIYTKNRTNKLPGNSQTYIYIVSPIRANAETVNKEKNEN
jgi:hypothetical protein